MATDTHLTVLRDTERGTWSVRLKYPDPLTGKRREKKKRGFKTRSAAEAGGHQLIADLVGGNAPTIGDATTTAGFARFKLYCDDRVEVGTLKQTTVDLYENAWRLYIAPYWAERPMVGIGGDDVRALFRMLRNEKGLQRGSLMPAWHVGRAIFHHAILAGDVRFCPFVKAGNRADVIGRESHLVKADGFWAPDDIAAFGEALDDDEDQFANVWRLMLATGMRRGEALAVSDDRIDFDNRTLVVDRQWTHNQSGEAFFTTPKTRAGERVVALNNLAVTALSDARKVRNEARMAHRDVWSDDQGCIFARGLRTCTRAGGTEGSQVPGTLPHPNLVSSAFRRYVVRHDLKPIRMHGLRHTFATSSLAAGVPLEVISKMLGHAGIEITANTYAHATPDLFTDAVDRLDAYYRLA